MNRRFKMLSGGLLAAACGLGCANEAMAAYETSVVVTGLNNPRGLAFGPDGALYVTEAGVASGTSPSITVRGDTFYGTTSGSVTRYANGTATRVVTGLSSEYDANTGDVVGPQGIVFTNGLAHIVVGTGFDPRLRGSLGPSGAGLGQLVTPGAASVDVSAYEVAHNPDGAQIDSNPFHAAAIAGGLLVADAGANALLRVSDAGAISTVAAFPARSIGGPFPTEAVPTSVAVGADGAYYVGLLTGFPFIPGAALVERVQPDGTTTTFADGFTMITDLAFGADGSLYVLQFDDDGLLNPGTVGSLWKLATNGARTLLFDDLRAPTGFAIASDGSFYISEYDPLGRGEVIRLAIPEPATIALLFVGGAVIARFARRRPPTEAGRGTFADGVAPAG